MRWSPPGLGPPPDRPRATPLGPPPRPHPSLRGYAGLGARKTGGARLQAKANAPCGHCHCLGAEQQPSTSLRCLRFALVISSPRTRAGRVSGVFFKIFCPLQRQETREVLPFLILKMKMFYNKKKEKSNAKILYII